jgi:hypothetical protein
MRDISVLLLISAVTLTLNAQEEPVAKKMGLEIKVGFNTLGPAHRMDKLMVENDFDETTSNWLFGGTNTHPSHGIMGVNTQLSFSVSQKPDRNIGIILDYSYLRQVTGYSLVAEWLSVSFSSFSMAFPVFGFELSNDQEGIELQAGPMVMINLGKETGTGTYPEKYIRFSPGLLAGATAKLWERHVTYGKVGLQFMSGLPVKMGPFIAENWFGDSDEIPEARYWFAHVNLVFNLGFHL